MSETELPSETNYTPMADPLVPEPEKKKEYSSDMGGIEKAAIAKLPKDATIEDFNRQRLTIIIPEKQKLQ
jgi:hypothetical protein